MIGVHDASFARQPGGGSQQGFLVAVGVMENQQRGRAIRVDWDSHKIRRVVKSTLAAEAAATTYALDRMMFVKLLRATMLYGKDAWMNATARLPGLLVTDCKSLLDLLAKEGSIPTESGSRWTSLTCARAWR